MKSERRNGFTLIELSSVLVIIGLLVGGVLVGRDLIKAAEVRAQISQIEGYNTAVNTFHIKYDAIPGDMNVQTATQFGFSVGANCTGQVGGRDGNGLIDSPFAAQFAGYQGYGEPELFWQDLTTPGLTTLIAGAFPSSGAPAASCNAPGVILTGSQIGQYFPAGKIGYGTSVVVGEYNGINTYYLNGILQIGVTGKIAAANATMPIPVLEAYKIDQKIDDGLPISGTVQAQAAAVGLWIAAPYSTVDTSSTCYNTTAFTYSITVNGGTGPNCSLSFQFQ